MAPTSFSECQVYKPAVFNSVDDKYSASPIKNLWWGRDEGKLQIFDEHLILGWTMYTVHFYWVFNKKGKQKSFAECYGTNIFTVILFGTITNFKIRRY